MDVAYNQHSNQARRKNRSSTNLNHLSLAPLTSKLPLKDHDALPDDLNVPTPRSTSYLQGKSAPTTPGLLSNSPARSSSHHRHASTPGAHLPKSKSATHLASRGRQSRSGNASPGHHRRRKDDSGALSARDRNDSDWLLRAGALISSEARESKGQAWLVSRASSTSLTGMHDEDEDLFERELARERELTSRHTSRRGSLGILDDETPNGSRLGSRSQSRAGNRSQMLTPLERHSIDGYFPHHSHLAEEAHLAGPDFVNLDEKLEAIDQDTSQEDEAHVRRLVKRNSAGVGTWFGNVLGWTLFSVEENDEESETEGEASDGEVEEISHSRRSSLRQFEGVVATSTEERMPPPKADEGGWQDAAWLLSVASKVLL